MPWKVATLALIAVVLLLSACGTSQVAKSSQRLTPTVETNSVGAVMSVTSAPTTTRAVTPTVTVTPTVAPSPTATTVSTPTPSPTPRPTSTPRAPTATATVATLPKVGQTANGATIAVTLHEVLDPAPPGDYLKPKPGFRWVAVDISIQNTGTKPGSYNPFFAKVRTSDNREHSVAFGGVEPDLGSSNDQPPGDTVRGWITFEVPTDATVTQLIYDGFGGNRIAFDLRP